MRKMIPAALVCLALVPPALGDVVLMKNGKAHQGQVTREGNRVLIKKALATIAVDIKDVEKIIRSETPSTRPAERPFTPTPTLGTPTRPEDRFTHPESHVFLTMRRLAATPGGLDGYTLREQIKQWRAKVHDGDRMFRRKWISPRDAERARDKFAETLARSRDLVSKIRRVSTTTSSGRAQRAKLRRSLGTYFRQAADVWPDELMREFLLAAAHLESLNYTAALQSFDRCSRTAPRVAAFRQGAALALAGRNRKIEALAACLDVLHLQPNSREAYDLVARAMEDTPGKLMAEPTFQTATEILALYETPTRKSYLRRGTTWLMPGRPWIGRENTLPTPPYDRLVFRQVVGVPVAGNALLVDHGALAEALEVFVAIDARTVVPASPQRTGTYGTLGTRRKTNVPVGLVTIEDFVFTPLEVGAALAKGQAVTAYGLGLYEEMGSQVRPVATVVQGVEADGTPRLSQKLVAGEVAGPVVGKDGRLVGFLEGKTDPMAEDGGPDRFVPVSALADLIRRASRTRSYFGGYGRVKRKITPKPAQGRYFVVFITAAEGGKKPRS